MLCPWCKRVDLPVHLLRRHIKYCGKSPRPRGRIRKARHAKKTEIDKLLRGG